MSNVVVKLAQGTNNGITSMYSSHWYLPRARDHVLYRSYYCILQCSHNVLAQIFHCMPHFLTSLLYSMVKNINDFCSIDGNVFRLQFTMLPVSNGMRMTVTCLSCVPLLPWTASDLKLRWAWFKSGFIWCPLHSITIPILSKWNTMVEKGNACNVQKWLCSLRICKCCLSA